MRRTMVLVVTIISVLFLGVMDYITGWEFGFFVFYFIPIALSAWLLGIRYSIGISILSSIVWFISDYYSGYPYSSVLFRYWNAGIRFLSFLSISFSISYYQLLVKERLLSQELKETLDHVKTLSGLIPICAPCKKSAMINGIGNRLRNMWGNTQKPSSIMDYVQIAIKSIVRKLDLIE